MNMCGFVSVYTVVNKCARLYVNGHVLGVYISMPMCVPVFMNAVWGRYACI